MSAHAVGKAGIHALAQCLASELGPLGIRVNSVAVGVIDGETSRSLPVDLEPQVREDIEYAIDASGGALRRNVTEREVAEAVLFLASGGFFRHERADSCRRRRPLLSCQTAAILQALVRSGMRNP